MTVEISSPYPFKTRPPSILLNESDYLNASHETLAGYGKFIDTPHNPPPIEQVPYQDPDSRSWRTQDAGTGINQAVIQGDFSSSFKSETRSIEATNLAVKSKGAENADYTIGWESETDPYAMRVVEFNNHKDAGQQFILKKGKASLFLLGSTPMGTCPNTLVKKNVHSDNIDPLTDLIVISLQKGEALEVGPSIYHQPLYPIDKTNDVCAYSIQGSIHNCTTCNFVKELGVDVSLRLQTPQNLSNKNNSLARFLHNYAFFTLSADVQSQAQLDSQEKEKRLALAHELQLKLEKMPLSESRQKATALSLNQLKKINQEMGNTNIYLSALISARINWLYSTGRFIYIDNTAFLYAADTLPLAYYCYLMGAEGKSGLLEGIHDAVNSMLVSKSPLQRINHQINKMQEQASPTSTSF
jgi:hypothetical protein